MKPVSVLFLCSSLDPGNDGVGDYTRKLACALIKYGHRASIIAINDRRTKSDVWQGKQCDDDAETEVLRLSDTLPWNVRLNKAKHFADAFTADWISLQYVPFGFHLKGLPFNLGKKLKKLAAHQRWHVMFHELSVNKDESLKFKLWSFLQERLINGLLQTLKPALITTNTEVYSKRLRVFDHKAKVLPLFSNITRITIAETNGRFDANIPGFLLKGREEYIIGTLFGSFDFKRWDIRSLLNKFSGASNHKKFLIASIGRMPSGRENWEALQKEYPHIIFLTFGIQDADFISYWLSAYTDFGILTTLPELAGKSGSFMAYKEHGVPVVCKEKTPELESYQILLDKVLTVVDTKHGFIVPARYPPVSVLNEVVERFVKELRRVDG